MNSRWRNLTLWVFSYLSFLLASMNEKFTCKKALISKECILLVLLVFHVMVSNLLKKEIFKSGVRPFRLCNYRGKQIEWSTRHFMINNQLF